jgi:hypothetical protein
MAELVIGAGAATGFLLLLRFSQARALSVAWWQWALTFLGFLYMIFVLEVVVGFLREGTPKGAAVMGTLLGFVGVVWAVILGRTVFFRKNRAESDRVGIREGESHA